MLEDEEFVGTLRNVDIWIFLVVIVSVHVEYLLDTVSLQLIFWVTFKFISMFKLFVIVVSL